jgi:hypothetical protein
LQVQETINVWAAIFLQMQFISERSGRKNNLMQEGRYIFQRSAIGLYAGTNNFMTPQAIR